MYDRVVKRLIALSPFGMDGIWMVFIINAERIACLNSHVPSSFFRMIRLKNLLSIGSVMDDTSR
jgi:hypothetical protein